MKVLIWVGYQKDSFDKQTWLDNGIGGSEYCAIKLADLIRATYGCITRISIDGIEVMS